MESAASQLSGMRATQGVRELGLCLFPPQKAWMIMNDVFILSGLSTKRVKWSSLRFSSDPV